MPLFKRCDGTQLKKLPYFRVLNPYMMRTRTGSTIFIPTQMDVTETLKYIKELSKKRGKKVSIFNVLLASFVRTFALRPELNRFVIGTKIYQRNKIQFSFVAKKQLTEKSVETVVKMAFSPFETITSIMDKLDAELNVARQVEGNKADKEVKAFGSLHPILLRLLVSVFTFLDRHNLAPASLIKSDPLYTSAFLTNMGSVGMKRGPYHHLFEWGNASIFLGISEYTKRPVVNEVGEVVVRDILDLIVTYDDRVSEGIYGVRAIQLMKSFIENPKQLEDLPNMPDDVLEELQLDPSYERVDPFTPIYKKQKKTKKQKKN